MGLVNHLIVFAKIPRMGIVKTRLAKNIGTVNAWAFTRQCIKDISFLARDSRWQCRLAVSGVNSVLLPNFWPQTHKIIAQGEGDLGDRMTRVIKNMPPGPVVIIGTDIPTIRTKHVALAFKTLGSNDAVFGPAKDGGYWLIGIKRRPVFKEIFQSVNWSTKTALKDTISNLSLIHI